MLIAGEASGDILASELIEALRVTPALQSFAFAPRFFGAGGARMAAAGADVVLDLCDRAIVGLSGVARHYLEFRRYMHQLLELALARQPDVVIGVDFSGFNLRFACALRRRLRAAPRFFGNWQPKFVQYVSPQVWASRAGRARVMAMNIDLLLCLFRFEQEWYASRVPALHVEFVGHPMVDRHRLARGGGVRQTGQMGAGNEQWNVLLLPGSRVGEVNRHLPVMLNAAVRLSQLESSCKPEDGQRHSRAKFTVVFPDQRLCSIAESLCGAALPDVEMQIGGLSEALERADVAIACTGTVTLECALHGVPTVAMYKTSWFNYVVGRGLISVRHLAMPNILAGEELFPEFIQHRATASNLARAARLFLEDVGLRESLGRKLGKVILQLGSPGAADRAAAAIGGLLQG